MSIFNHPIFAKSRSQDEIVDLIHSEIDTAQDRLLQEAKELLSSFEENKKDEYLYQRAIRLEMIGFNNTPTVKKALEQSDLFYKMITEKFNVRDFAELIQYYQREYPLQKFLTITELDRICKKWNLIYAPVRHYIKDVPEKNISEIEKALPLKSQDEAESICELIIEEFWSDAPGELRRFCDKNKIYISRHEQGKFNNEDEAKKAIIKAGYTGSFGKYIFRSARTELTHREGLFICAPKTHFDLKGLNQQGLGFHSITVTKITDPIVFRYCKGGVHVISKWGKEANDPDLAHGIDN